MKKFLYILAILLSLSLSFTSCTKEEFVPVEQITEDTIPSDPELRIYGKYVLLSGKMYITNLETGEKTKFDHFGPNKDYSSLRYSGSMYDFEDLEQNITTWEFYAPAQVPGYGEFVLNGDSLDPYGFYVTKNNWTIVEHPLTNNMEDIKLGGSARPISGYVEDYDEQIVVVYVQDAYENINGWNCKYYSALRFRKIEEW